MGTYLITFNLRFLAISAEMKLLCDPESNIALTLRFPFLVLNVMVTVGSTDGFTLSDFMWGMVTAIVLPSPDWLFLLLDLRFGYQTFYRLRCGVSDYKFCN